MSSVVEHVVVSHRNCNEQIVNHSFITKDLNELT